MQPLSLYIHWPFCLSKCPYCDFNSHVREAVDHADWKKGLLTELHYWAERTKGRPLASVFFGGGTPSLMEPATVAALIDEAVKIWPAALDLEITLEANPTSVEAEKLKGFKAAGINRVSLGVQSLRDEHLKALGRHHSAGEAVAAVKLATSLFDRVSFDLIYARPNQSLQSWREELSEALAMAKGHLSLYQLTIEPGTQFATLHQRGDLITPNEDLGADFYDLTQEMCKATGLPAYEISNHAAAGQESRHNLAYWRYDDYIGIGPGAHGRIEVDGTKYATRTHRAPEEWLERVKKDGHALTEQRELSRADQLDELLLMNLRLREGINRPRLLQRYGTDITELCRPEALTTYQKHGLIELTDKTLRATPEGLKRLNTLIGELRA